MIPLVDEPIAAPASAPGPAVDGIIRLSGGDVRRLLDALFEPDDRECWRDAKAPRRHGGRMRVAAFRNAIPLDVLLWPGPRSYTGQPMAEIHAVGSAPVLEAILAELYRRGARPAEPGEFTLRAFLSGRIDLVQAEAVMGVVDSADRNGLERALRQLAGNVSGRIAALHADLLELLADLEAGLDFVDEDIEFVSRDEVLRRLEDGRRTLDELQARTAGRMVSSGRMSVVLAGLPNAGKSTLFNALAGSAAALVSDERGTTRDYLRAELEWDGLSLLLVDTAGWELTPAAIASEAQRFREEQVQQANLVLWCTAADLDAESAERDAELRYAAAGSTGRLLPVQTKSDLGGSSAGHCDLAISAVTGEGLPALRESLRRLAGETPPTAGELLGTTAARCERSLREAREALGRAVAVAGSEFGDELVAAELREAIDALGQIVGAVYTDDLLDRIFSRFCIGK